jgi:hypothetical protein
MRRVALIVLIVVFQPLFLHAQEDLRWFGPDLGLMDPGFSYGTRYYGARDVAGRGTDFSFVRHDVDVRIPVRQDREREWSVSGALRAQDFRTEARLPDSGESFPGTLWDVQAGTQYRRRLDNGWIAGGAVTLSSPSDRPFASRDEAALGAVLFSRLPDGGRNAWLFMLYYSNRREFLNNVPLPGVGYWWEPSDKLRVMAGFPFIHLQAKPVSDVVLDFAYFPVRNIHAGASRFFGEIRIHGEFDWRNQSWFRADRSDPDARLFYYEKTASAGVDFPLWRKVSLDVSAGYAFDRFYFEGKEYSDRDRNRIDVNDGWFSGIKLTAKF